jgi:hypothetical protein
MASPAPIGGIAGRGRDRGGVGAIAVVESSRTVPIGPTTGRLALVSPLGVATR